MHDCLRHWLVQGRHPIYIFGDNDDDLEFLCLCLCTMPLDIGLYIEALNEYLWVMTNIRSDYLIKNP